jgi:phenylpropionate dioxygenase-like ring-hydroxylating dioxygenase large terminal subunit
VALDRGRIRDGVLECPYHGWRFAPGGGCVHVPSMPDGTPPPNATLRVYPSRVANGYVWAALEQPYLDLPDIAPQAGDGWELRHSAGRDVGCGLRQLTENFRDISHFPFVHSETMGPDSRRVVDPYQVVRDGWHMRFEMETELGGTALDGNAALARTIHLTHAVDLPMAAAVRTAFPDGGRRFLSQYATPITADGNRVRTYWTLGIDRIVREEHGVSMDRMWRYEDEIFEEDYHLIEALDPPESPLDLHRQVHTRADKFSLVYRRMYAELLARFAAGHGLPGPAGGRAPALTGEAIR